MNSCYDLCSKISLATIMYHMVIKYYSLRCIIIYSYIYILLQLLTGYPVETAYLLVISIFPVATEICQDLVNDRNLISNSSWSQTATNKHKIMTSLI